MAKRLIGGALALLLVTKVAALSGFPMWLDAPTRSNAHDPKSGAVTPRPTNTSLPTNTPLPTATATPTATNVPAGSTPTFTATATPSPTASPTQQSVIPTPRLQISEPPSGIWGQYAYHGGTSAVATPVEVSSPTYNGGANSIYISLTSLDPSSYGAGCGFSGPFAPLDISTATQFVMVIKTDKPLTSPYITLTAGAYPNHTFDIQYKLPDIPASANWQVIQVPANSFQNMLSPASCTYGSCNPWTPSSGNTIDNFDIQFVPPTTNGASDGANIYIANIGFN